MGTRHTPSGEYPAPGTDSSPTDLIVEAFVSQSLHSRVQVVTELVPEFQQFRRQGRASYIVMANLGRGNQPALVAEANEFVKEVVILLESLKVFAKKAGELVDSAYAELESMEQNVAKYAAKVKLAYQDLVTAADQASRYIERVNKLFEYAGKNPTRLDRAKERVRHRRLRTSFLCWRSRLIPEPDYEPLRDFLDQLKRFLARTEQVYVEFNETMDKAIGSSTEVAEDCRSKARESQKEQEKTKIKGAVVAGGVVAGLCTGGYGFITGVAAGAGAPVVTAKIVDGLKDTEDSFRKLISISDSLSCAGSDMNESALNVRRKLEALACAVDDIEHNQRGHETVESVCSSLDRMCDKLGESYTVSSRCYATVEGKKSDLKHILNDYDILCI